MSQAARWYIVDALVYLWWVFDDSARIFLPGLAPEVFLCGHAFQTINRLLLDPWVFLDSWILWIQVFGIFLEQTRLSELIFVINWFYLFDLHVSNNPFEPWDLLAELCLLIDLCLHLHLFKQLLVSVHLDYWALNAQFRLRFGCSYQLIQSINMLFNCRTFQLTLLDLDRLRLLDLVWVYFWDSFLNFLHLFLLLFNKLQLLSQIGNLLVQFADFLFSYRFSVVWADIYLSLLFREFVVPTSMVILLRALFYRPIPRMDDKGSRFLFTLLLYQLWLLLFKHPCFLKVGFSDVLHLLFSELIVQHLDMRTLVYRRLV